MLINSNKHTIREIMYNALLLNYKFEKLFVRTCVCDTIMYHEKVCHTLHARTSFFLYLWYFLKLKSCRYLKINDNNRACKKL